MKHRRLRVTEHQQCAQNGQLGVGLESGLGLVEACLLVVTVNPEKKILAGLSRKIFTKQESRLSPSAGLSG